MARERSEQELVRIEKLSKVRSQGFRFPNDAKPSTNAKLIIDGINEGLIPDGDSSRRDTLAGRIMTLRLMGKAAFCHIQDSSGKIQIYVKHDDVGEQVFNDFKSLDLGDIVEVQGYPFKTKTGEPSIHVSKLRLLVKCLHPLPEKWHGLTDVEIRYRKRYLDLMVSPEVREVFVTRAKIITAIRNFFDNHGYVEVETPVLSNIASGAAAKPFVTHHNALDVKLHLRIAPELPLKRLVVGGLERVYELGRVFRNEGVSTQHNPEFTMIEFYEAYATYTDFMDLTEELIVGLVDQVSKSRIVEYDGKQIDFSPPWKRMSIVEAVHELGEVPRDVNLLSLEGVYQAAELMGLPHVMEEKDYGLALYALFDPYIEEKITNPTFITRFPRAVSPLSRSCDDDPRFVDRFELICAGMELANAFSELNDAEDQFKRFQGQVAAKARGDEEAMAMDEDFVTALEYGLPPTAGEGIGIDRLVMILTGSASIRDVILFPQMRPDDSTVEKT